MIVGSNFVWLHFPKCAGTATHSALRRLAPDAKFDSGDRKQHDSVRERQTVDPSFHVGSRKIICGFRRLPHWLLSRVHYGAHRGWPVVTREMLLIGHFTMKDGTTRTADYNALRFSQTNVDHWVRTEHIAEDLGRALDIDCETVRTALVRENETPPYIGDLTFWFTKEELAGLYRASPIWTAIELKLYGSLLA